MADFNDPYSTPQSKERARMLRLEAGIERPGYGRTPDPTRRSDGVSPGSVASNPFNNGFFKTAAERQQTIADHWKADPWAQAQLNRSPMERANAINSIAGRNLVGSTSNGVVTQQGVQRSAIPGYAWNHTTTGSELVPFGEQAKYEQLRLGAERGVGLASRGGPAYVGDQAPVSFDAYGNVTGFGQNQIGDVRKRLNAQPSQPQQAPLRPLTPPRITPMFPLTSIYSNPSAAGMDAPNRFASRYAGIPQNPFAPQPRITGSPVQVSAQPSSVGAASAFQEQYQPIGENMANVDVSALDSAPSYPLGGKANAGLPSPDVYSLPKTGTPITDASSGLLKKGIEAAPGFWDWLTKQAMNVRATGF